MNKPISTDGQKKNDPKSPYYWNGYSGLSDTLMSMRLVF